MADKNLKNEIVSSVAYGTDQIDSLEGLEAVKSCRLIATL